MKQVINLTEREQLLELKKQLEITETKLNFTSDAKLIAALSYELLALKARMGYLIDASKKLSTKN